MGPVAQCYTTVKQLANLLELRTVGILKNKFKAPQPQNYALHWDHTILELQLYCGKLVFSESATIADLKFDIKTK